MFLRKVGARPCAESQSKYYSPSPSSKFEHSLMNTTTKIQHMSYFKRHFAANKFQNVTNVEFRSLPLIFNSPFDLSYVSSLKQNVIVKRSSKISENCLYFKLFFNWKFCSLSKYDLKKSYLRFFMNTYENFYLCSSANFRFKKFVEILKIGKFWNIRNAEHCSFLGSALQGVKLS